MRYRKSYIDYKGRKTYDYGNEGATIIGGSVVYGSSSSSSTPSTKPQSVSPLNPTDTGTTTYSTTNVSMVAYETNTGDTAGHWTADVDGLTHITDGTLVSMRISTACYKNSEGYNTLNINGTGAKMVWFDYNKPLKQELYINDEVLLVYREDAGRYTLPNPNTGELISDVIPSDGTVRSGWIIVSSDAASLAGDMRNYYTRDEVDTLITQALARTITSGQVMTLIENYLNDNNYIHYELISPSDYENLTNPDPNTLYITGLANYLGGINMCCGGGGGGGDTPYYNVSPLTIHDEGSGGTYIITVMSNTGYTLQSSDNWFTFSPQSGYGYGEFSVVIPSGETYRTGSIVIGDKTVSIIQGDKGFAQYLTMNIISGGTLMYINQDLVSEEHILFPVQYRINSGSWSSPTSTSSLTLSVSQGDVVEWKGENETLQKNVCFAMFRTPPSGGCHFNLEGNILSLMYGDNFASQTSLTGIFYNLFLNTKVHDASGLKIAAAEREGSYIDLFRNCGYLTAAPALPATTLGNSCYRGMFANCPNLNAAPALPATSITRQCYYEMFSGCTSLTTAPELNADTLPIECYYKMFSGCTNLNYVKCLATSFDTYSVNNWLSNVSPTGTFVKASGASWSTGASGIPSGWTVETA